jgi:hypothetical protein
MPTRDASTEAARFATVLGKKELGVDPFADHVR